MQAKIRPTMAYYTYISLRKCLRSFDTEKFYGSNESFNYNLITVNKDNSFKASETVKEVRKYENPASTEIRQIFFPNKLNKLKIGYNSCLLESVEFNFL